MYRLIIGLYLAFAALVVSAQAPNPESLMEAWVLGKFGEQIKNDEQLKAAASMLDYCSYSLYGNITLDEIQSNFENDARVGICILEQGEALVEVMQLVLNGVVSVDTYQTCIDRHYRESGPIGVLECVR